MESTLQTRVFTPQVLHVIVQEMILRSCIHVHVVSLYMHVRLGRRRLLIITIVSQLTEPHHKQCSIQHGPDYRWEA
jgi:hypothetical protein